MARTALVTGGSRGIGASISKALKDAGYQVAATFAGNEEKAAAFTAETGIKTYKWNVADYEESKAGLAQVEADLGPIDVVVANAGITRDAPFHKMTPEQWHEVVDTNLTGVFNTVHPVWGGMRERKFGRIIVISSINGQKGQFAQVNYAATKAGDLGIVKSLAQEGARAGITANAICPGYIATDMVMAVPEKVRESIIAQI
ncbi:MAG: SDR family NAD(P)-dependent oxidoreductase, partial [Pseudomonadota bacterium]|nr:SDR family NAD(P)-dependent oxidoreductase [Pseudomonadota bacterium]